MSFRLTHVLPRRCVVAASGGVDSTVALYWLSRVQDRVAKVVHVNHASGAFAESAQAQVEETCALLGLPLEVYHVDNPAPKEGESLENHWREERYRKLEEAHRNNDYLPIVLAHTLDDCLEEYVMSTMVRGFVGTIPYKRGPCIRPFRLWKRADIEDYAKANGLSWLDDPTNVDTARFKRAKIRRLVVPRIKNLNPGVYNIVERVIKEQDERDGNQGS